MANPLAPQIGALVDPNANNPLMSQAPNSADAVSAAGQAYREWLKQQHDAGVVAGMIDPETGWPTDAGWHNAALQYGAALIGGTRAPEGAIYHRFTRGAVDNGTGFMMYADKAGKVDHYGPNHYEMNTSKIDPAQIVDASSKDFQRKLIASLKDNPEVLDSLNRPDISAAELAKQTAAEAAPHDINDSAGFWDNLDLVSHAWDRVMEPNGWTVVKTPDGAISFDPAHAKLTPYHGR